jgi:tetratricopeptide (TPR) repeat protein/TolB-like protein
MLGETVSHFRLTEKLGAGAMGEVFLAEDLHLRRPVALKMLAGGDSTDEQAGARLVREARVASALNHPNIAVIYEVGEMERDGQKRAFIAMEYVAGRTLAALHGERRLAMPEVLAIVRQVADALAEAHDRGVVHRDVKPGNVIVTASGRAKVLDFGLAKYVAPIGEDTETWSGRHRGFETPGALLGTLAYMSPEQARGGEIDARSDVFSLGIVLYELVAGRRPFSGESAVELLASILREEPPPLVRDGEPVSQDLQRLVSDMLAKDRDRRPAGMREVLERIAALGPEGGRAAAALPEGRTVAVMSFANITGRPEDDWLGTGIAETVAADLKSVPGLHVLSRERVFEVARSLGSGPDEGLAVRLGREVGAGLVVSGAYQRAGDLVRATARVTETETGSVLQTLKTDGRMDDVFALQDRIVSELSAGLRLRVPVTPSSEDQETQSVEAYEAYTKGLLNFRAETPESLDRAILFFERAVTLDPSYASAHAELGSAYEVKASYFGMRELNDRAIASLRRAIELRPLFAHAWRELAPPLLALGRDDEAVEALERALSLDPVDATAYSVLGRVYFIGRGDFTRGVEAYERALTLNPQAGWSALQLAHCAALLRDFPRAEAAAWRAVVSQEEFLSGKAGVVIVGAYVRLGQIYALQGRFEEARHQFERELEFLRRVDHALKGRIVIEVHQRLGEAHQKLGDPAAGKAALDLSIETFERRLRTGADDPFTRYYAACAYALRGDKDAALDSLERAIEGQRLFNVARARIEPALDRLRSEPRFRELVGGD